MNAGNQNSVIDSKLRRPKLRHPAVSRGSGREANDGQQHWKEQLVAKCRTQDNEEKAKLSNGI